MAHTCPKSLGILWVSLHPGVFCFHPYLGCFFNGDDDGDDHDNEVDDDAEVDDDLMLLLFFVVVDTMMLTMIISILGVKPPFRGHPWLL